MNNMSNGNRFSDEQVMAWFKIGGTIPGLEETRAAIPKTAGGYIRQEMPAAEPGVPLRKPHNQSHYCDSSDEEEIKGLTINPYDQSNNNAHEYDKFRDLCDQPKVLSLPKCHSTKDPIKSLTLGEVEENGVYSRYSFDHEYNKYLPITEKRQTILDTINHYPVTIIQGETGSGKTTQVPQYILDQCAKQNKHCNIICTQPRRIATTSIAKFICRERNWQLGNLVGYQIQLDKKTSDDTRLTFCTTGVLLQKLVNQRNLNEYTHVILDEVHERDKDTDFCLLLVRRFQSSNSPLVKIVLMSATIDSSMFSNYFSTSEGPAPVVDISGKFFPVTEVYLESLIRFGTTESYSPFDVDDAKLHPEMVQLAANLIKRLDEEIECGHRSHAGGSVIRGTVLVFLPGLPEIKLFDQVLQERCADSKLLIIPLHSSITHDEQLKAFIHPSDGKRKVILATNIAESSITVPDIRYVIDFGLVKELTCDPYTNYQCLKLRWASKASMTQRKGRAGRVASGVCFRLMEKDFYLKWCSEHSTPEMLRCPLESLVLSVKTLDIGGPRSILRLALEPPHLSDIEKTILNLKEVGALTAFIDGVSNPYDGNLTFLGRVLSSLPIDVHVGKLCVLGHVFGCLEEAIVVASALSLKSMFIHPYRRPMDGYKSKMSWAEDHFSDCIAIVVAFKEWKNAKINGRFDLGGKEEKSWCQHNLINRSVIKEVSELVEDLTRRLAKHNIVPQRSVLSKPLHSSPHEYFIFKVVLAGAFYPNYFTWKISDEELSLRQMSGLDPTTTVMLSGLPPHPHQYRALLCQMFGAYGKGKALHFDGSRCYVEFERTRPSQNRYSCVGDARNVIPAVYLAVKAAQLKIPHIVYSSESADEALNQIDQKSSKNQWMLSGKRRVIEPPAPKQKLALTPVPLPKLGYIQITVTEMIDAGHFWAQLSDAVALSNLAAMVVTIETTQLAPLSRPEEQHIGSYCLANFSIDKKYYRARIENISAGSAHVVFVDYGNMEAIPFSSLRQLPANLASLPIQAFECFLSEIRPSHEHSSEGKWTTEANNFFHQLTSNKPLVAQVYSKIGDDVLRVRLWDTISDKDIFINKLLVEEGYAERMEEPFQSKHLHLLAQQEHQNTETLGIASMQMPQNTGNKPRASHIAAVGSSRRSEPWNMADQPNTHCQKTGGYPSGSGQIRHWNLKGPSNPYEVSYYSMCKIGRTKGVRVERDSVNSVTIDNEPQDKHERIMIAAHVGLNPSGNSMILRDTALMPNIHGLAGLICLLFAPTVEMRTDEDRSQYTGVLCGLGWDPSTGKGLYEDHDIECTFDTVVTQEDFDQINKLRGALNLVISEEGLSEWGVNALLRFQKKVRDLLLRVFLNKRKPMTPTHCKSSYKWNQIPLNYILYPQLKDPLDDKLSIYPMHNGIDITGLSIDQRSTALERIRLLHKKASKSDLPEQIYCEFCNVNCGSPRELFTHLYSKEHKEQEEVIMNEQLS